MSPLDPRIPLSAVGIQTQSPFEALQPVLQARAAQQQMEIGDAQLETHRLAVEQAGRARQRQAQVDAALEQATIIDPETGRPRVDPSRLIGHLPASLLPEVMKQVDADMKSGQDVQTAALNLDAAKKKHILGAAETTRAAGYDPDIFRIQVRVAQKLHAIDNETATEYLAIDDPATIKQLVDNILKPPPGAPQAVQTVDAQGNNVTQFVTPEAGAIYPNQPPKEEVVPVQTVDEHGRRVTKMVPKKAGESYPDQPKEAELAEIQTVDDQGNPVIRFVPKTAGASYPAAPKAPKDLTAEERKNAGFHSQMRQAVATINQLESQLTPKDLYQIQSLPQEGFMGAVNRSGMSDAAKRYVQAFNQFTEARLRPVSGAAINADEYARDRATYAKQYGETPDLAKQRTAARANALQALRVMAGHAATDDELAVSHDKTNPFRK